MNTTRRNALAGLFAIIASQKCPAIVRSMVGYRNNLTTIEAPNQDSTVNLYVQDGLVAMWDGIENADVGIHDTNATTWKDLTGNGYDWFITDLGVWDNNCFCSIASSNNPAATAISMPPSPEGTQEIVLKTDAVNSSRTGVVLKFGQNYFAIAVNPSSNGMIMVSESNRISPNGYSNVTSFQQESYSIIRGPYSSGNYYPLEGIFKNGIQLDRTGQKFGNYVGGRNEKYIGTEYWSSWWKGKIYSCRIYNRALTREEIAYNYEIDKVRFNLP